MESNAPLPQELQTQLRQPSAFLLNALGTRDAARDFGVYVSDQKCWRGSMLP
jgi:hypothetical protein